MIDDSEQSKIGGGSISCFLYVDFIVDDYS